MNLAWRDIRHNFGRFLLTCAGLALLLGVVQSMVGIYRGVVAEILVENGEAVQYEQRLMLINVG